jgi:hypothetical protein
MRLSDKWVCNSVALHLMTANKQYIATYKRFPAEVNMLLAYEGRVLGCGSSRVNIEMVVEGKWCPGSGRCVVHPQYWETPVLGVECFRTRN